MAAILEYVLIPASLVLVLGLVFWSHRRHGEVFALKRGSAVYPIVAVLVVLATLGQIAVPMEYKHISQPLSIVMIAWAFGALVAAGLWQRRGEAAASEPRA